MNIALNAEMKKFIADELKAGRYGKPADVVRAAMHALMQQSVPSFAPGELDALIAAGEESISRHGTVDGEASFRARRRRRVAQGLLRAPSGKLRK